MIETLHAGFAQTDLHAPLDFPLDGYDARIGTADGYLDPLKIRVCFVQGIAPTACLITLDVLGVSAAFVRRVQNLLSDLLGLSAYGVNVAATHTHSGPVGFAHFPNGRTAETQFAQDVIKSIVDVTQRAHKALRPALLRHTFIHTEGIAANRIHPEVPVNDSLHAILLTDAEHGTPLGVIGNYACHPTVLGHDNLQYSADLFGYATRVAEEALGCTCILTNGASADISTRYTRQAQTMEEVARLGNCLGTAWISAVRAVSSSSPANPSRMPVQIACQSVDLKLKNLPSPGEAARVFKTFSKAYRAARSNKDSPGVLRDLWTRVEGARVLWQRSLDSSQPQSITLNITALRLDKIAYLFIPGEVFNTTFQAWQQADNTAAMWRLVTLANGYFGYFPTKQAMEENFYEALASPFDTQATDTIWEVATKLLWVLRQQRG